MARVSDGIIQYPTVLGLSLDRYQELMKMQISLSAFNGLLRTDDVEHAECTQPWTQNDRDALALVLAMAEEMREQELGFSPSLKWVIGERHVFKNPVLLDRKYVRRIGIPKLTLYQANVAILLRIGGEIQDPISFDLEVPPDTLPENVFVTLPGDNQEVKASSVIINATTATVKIPRPRLVSLAAMNRTDLRYDDDSVFTTTLDVYLSTVDQVGAKAVWLQPGCAGGYLTQTNEQDLYVDIRSARIGSVEARYGDHVDGDWLAVTQPYCRKPDYMVITYQAGMETLSNSMLTMALAHTLIPYQLSGKLLNVCSCWKPDLVDSKVMTPYGNMMGAYRAWLQDSRSKIQGGVFPGMEIE